MLEIVLESVASFHLVDCKLFFSVLLPYIFCVLVYESFINFTNVRKCHNVLSV